MKVSMIAVIVDSSMIRRWISRKMRRKVSEKDSYNRNAKTPAPDHMTNHLTHHLTCHRPGGVPLHPSTTGIVIGSVTEVSTEISFKYVDYSDVFFKEKAHRLSEHGPHDHVIETEGLFRSGLFIIYR